MNVKKYQIPDLVKDSDKSFDNSKLLRRTFLVRWGSTVLNDLPDLDDMPQEGDLWNDLDICSLKHS